MNVQLIVLILIVTVLILIMIGRKENFNIPVRSSSAWDWNTGPGYGAGYGTGYAMWGVWPANLPKEPWKNWMWGRRPSVFITPYTPAPQIDYNDAPDSDSDPESNYNVSLLPTPAGNSLSINGFAKQTLQLDRGRVYYFHIYTPGAPFAISDSEKLLTNPIEEGTIQLKFDQADPDQLFYLIPGKPDSTGIIYLNPIRPN